MISDRLEQLINAWSDCSLSSTQANELNHLLRHSADARKRFREAAQFHGLLHAAANAIAIENAAQQSSSILTSGSLHSITSTFWRFPIGVIVGILAGVLSVGAVWAYASNSLVVVSALVGTLRDPSFEQSSGAMSIGFPTELGVWGGDDIQIVDEQVGRVPDGRRAAQFVTAKSDASRPNEQSIACDMFQLVDLQGLRETLDGQDAELELTAAFNDQRPRNTNPSVTFFCQLYLFRGDPKIAHTTWPQNISEAAASGSAQITTLGDSGWRNITARCLVPEDVTYAVVHLAARPNLRVPMPKGLVVDHARFKLKTRPVLPVRDAYMSKQQPSISKQ
jgi:hypothetical protein